MAVGTRFTYYTTALNTVRRMREFGSNKMTKHLFNDYGTNEVGCVVSEWVEYRHCESFRSSLFDINRIRVVYAGYNNMMLFFYHAKPLPMQFHGFST